MYVFNTVCTSVCVSFMQMCIYYIQPINTKYKSVIKKSKIILLLVPVKLVIAAVVWLLSHQIDNTFTAEDSAISRPGYDTSSY